MEDIFGTLIEKGALVLYSRMYGGKPEMRLAVVSDVRLRTRSLQLSRPNENATVSRWQIDYYKTRLMVISDKDINMVPLGTGFIDLIHLMRSENT